MIKSSPSPCKFSPSSMGFTSTVGAKGDVKSVSPVLLYVASQSIVAPLSVDVFASSLSSSASSFPSSDEVAHWILRSICHPKPQPDCTLAHLDMLV